MPHYYQDTRKRWRWTLISANNKKVCREAEGDGFSTKAAAARNFARAKRLIKTL